MSGEDAQSMESKFWTLSSGEQPTPIWLDCDTGHDDAFAILLAAHCPKLQLLGVSTVHGNSSLQNTTKNTLSILEAIGRRDIDVYPGAAKPFCREAVHAPDIHGESGLDGTTILPKPVKGPIVSQGNAAVFGMYNAISKTAPGTAWLVSTGAMTNIGLLFAVYPSLADHIAGLSVMGGAIGGFFTSAPVGRMRDRLKLTHDVHSKLPQGVTDENMDSLPPLVQHFRDLGILVDHEHLDEDHMSERLEAMRNSFGNTTNFAEFNIFCDPEAAASVFSNPTLAAKTTLIPLDVTHQVLGNAAVQKLLSNNHDGTDGKLANTAVRHLFLEIMTFFAHTYEREFGMHDGPPLHDPLAVAAAFAPDLFNDNDSERYEVFVIRTGDEESFDGERKAHNADQCGRTVARMLASGQPGIRIPRGLQVPEFWELINLALRKADEASNLSF